MKKSVLTIAQISDLHIGGESDLVQNIDVRENFRRALYSKSVESADVIFLSGDLTDDGSVEGYEFVKKEMERRNKPWRFILGNHDNYANCFKVFNKESDCPFDSTYDYAFDLHGHHFICLDTGKGEITTNQGAWLKANAALYDDVYLLTHYPPCICGHKFMDKNYALKDIDKVQALLAKIKNLHFIFCGHYHAKFNIVLPSGQKVYVAPPTQMQIDSNEMRFKLKTSSPSWQMLYFEEDKVRVEVCKA